MALRILHTADWHLGQTFYEYDRAHEHEVFLEWLKKTLLDEAVDVMLVCGDIFDVSNPSAASLSMFYNFLKDVNRLLPHLQIICVAGNHDSAARLESPKMLLEVFNVHVVGAVPRASDGEIDYAQLCIPLKNRNGETEAFCLAIPFLRQSDYPRNQGVENAYSAGVATVYTQAARYAEKIRTENQAIIATGHLHTLNAEISGDDKSERAIMGGIEFIPSAAFPESVSYMALGHIHKAQCVGGKENIRYSGSPLPMSFSEIHYKHQVVLIDVENGQIEKISPLEIPVTVGLLNVPHRAKSPAEVLAELENLPEAGEDKTCAPYLQVKVLLNSPEPHLRNAVETAIENKHVKLARIDVQYEGRGVYEKGKIVSVDELQNLNPLDMLLQKYKSRFDTEMPDELKTLFNLAVEEVNAEES